jgi:hypothetical protein
MTDLTHPPPGIATGAYRPWQDAAGRWYIIDPAGYVDDESTVADAAEAVAMCEWLNGYLGR